MARMAIARGAPIDHQFRIIRPSVVLQRSVHDRCGGECDASGRPLRLHGVNIDMTAMRQVQEALAASEEQYRGTFEHANVGVAHVSVDGRFLRANGYLCKLLGRSEAELQALTFQDITHPEDLGSDLDLLLQLMDGKIPSYTLEKRYVRPDGTLIWTDLNVALIRNDEGLPLHFVTVITDIQQRRQAQELVKLVLDEANHRVKNLLSVVGAIVKTSARSAGSVKQFEEAVSLRLKGIAASHDLLMGKSIDGGDLTQLIRRQLEIFTDCSIERVIMAGPPVELCPRAVHAFGM
ncbi:MAG: PAS domain S-box protein, partial [Novosphingobium sp.]